MVKSLYRSVGGDLLRVPSPAHVTSYAGVYWGIATDCPDSDCKGQLWRGVEICCPSWTVAPYASHYLAPIEDVASSIYTPLYLTVMDISGLVDCGGCDIDGEEMNNIGGATRILLTQNGLANPQRWQGTWVGPTKTWAVDLSISAGQVMSAYAGQLAGNLVFKYISAAGVGFDPRWGPTWTSDYVVGGCCAAGQACHSGTMTLASGDLT